MAFKIRYVAVYGPLDTPINQMKAHTMMGAVLARARKILTDKRRGLPRFRFDLADAYKMNQLNRLFLVLDGLTSRWDIGDGILILDMLTNTHNEEVGVVHGKNRTQIWKGRKNLLNEEYRALKDALMELARQPYRGGMILRYIPALVVFICQELVGLIGFPALNRYLGPGAATRGVLRQSSKVYWNGSC